MKSSPALHSSPTHPLLPTPQDKIDVNGPSAHPLYNYLKQEQPVSVPGDVRSRGSGTIEWNYTKFLIGRDGQPVKRYKPGFDPLEAEGDVSCTC